MQHWRDLILTLETPDLKVGPWNARLCKEAFVCHDAVSVFLPFIIPSERIRTFESGVLDLLTSERLL